MSYKRTFNDVEFLEAFTKSFNKRQILLMCLRDTGFEKVFICKLLEISFSTYERERRIIQKIAKSLVHEWNYKHIFEGQRVDN